MSQSRKPSILVLPRWYPNRLDIQLGTFIRQQTLLLKDDFDLSVIYVQSDTSLEEPFELIETTASGIHEIIVYFKPGTDVFAKITNARRYKKAQQLGFERLDKKIDLCHVHVPYRPVFLALKLLREEQVPFVITEHWSGHLTGEYQRKNSLDKKLYKKVLHKSSGITSVSQLLAQKFKLNTGFDSVVIPNCIDFVQVSEDAEFSDRFELLSVSDMIDSIKNVSGLLHAFADALQSNSNLHLTLIGGGPDEEKILDLIADLNIQQHVSFRGRLSHEAVLHEMNQCHFYICNSNFETFGMTVAEALRCGKPVISTRCGGPEEFLNETNSIRIDPKSNRQLTEAMLKMADSLENYDSEKMAAEIENRFGKEVVRKLWLAFYETYLP